MRCRFLLEKWYLDAVSPEGDAAILYHASARIGPVILRHRSTLWSPTEGAPSIRKFASRSHEPTLSEAGCDWQTEFGTGVWTRNPGADAFTIRLLDTPAGSIDWTVQVPAGDVQFDSNLLRGTGYVEYLRMTLPPWRFPHRHLRWGRVITPTDWLVWIDWRDGNALGHAVDVAAGRTWIVTSAGVQSSGVVGDTSVESAVVSARISSARVIYEGRFRDTIGSIARLASPFLSHKFFDSYETKWFGRATVQSPSGISYGTAIHEHVVFAHRGGGAT